MFIGFNKLSSKSVLFSLVLHRLSAKCFLFHWFYKVVYEKFCFFISFTKLSAKSLVFSLVLQGCPRKVLFFHWFYKVVHEKCCFFIGFTMVVHENLRKPLVFKRNVTKVVRGQLFRARFWKKRVSLSLAPPLAIEPKRLSLAHAASPRPLARTNETKRFPG